MALFEDELPKPPTVHSIGEDLSSLSLEELAARIDLLKSEIGRLEEAISAKQASASAAETFFKR